MSILKVDTKQINDKVANRVDFSKELDNIAKNILLDLSLGSMQAVDVDITFKFKGVDDYIFPCSIEITSWSQPSDIRDNIMNIFDHLVEVIKPYIPNRDIDIIDIEYIEYKGTKFELSL